eukprot:SAG11_NODE_29997_length_305_cov_0.752427_1_plen_88_part_10
MYTPEDKPGNPRPPGTHPARSLEEAEVASAAGLGAVPAEFRCGYDYWLASNMLEFTSEAYSTVLYNNANERVQLPGYRADACTDAAIA